MQIYASQRYVRQAPRKVRLVANAVKDMPLEQAFRQLAVMQRSASIPVIKTLRQAVANGQHNYNVQPTEMRIKSIVVENGPIYKRFRAVSRGRAHSIQKKTSHIVVRLELLTDLAVAGEKKVKISSSTKKTNSHIGTDSSKQTSSVTKKAAKSDKSTDVATKVKSAPKATKKVTKVKNLEKTAKK